jgi:hypothetical protein
LATPRNAIPAYSWTDWTFSFAKSPGEISSMRLSGKYNRDPASGFQPSAVKKEPLPGFLSFRTRRVRNLLLASCVDAAEESRSLDG